LASIAWGRNAIAATSAALIALWRAARLGLRNAASRTNQLIAAGIGACAQAVHRAFSYVQTTADRTAAALAARARRMGHRSREMTTRAGNTIAATATAATRRPSSQTTA